MNFNFDICVGGGCSVVLFCVCAFFFASDSAFSVLSLAPVFALLLFFVTACIIITQVNTLQTSYPH